MHGHLNFISRYSSVSKLPRLFTFPDGLNHLFSLHPSFPHRPSSTSVLLSVIKCPAFGFQKIRFPLIDLEDGGSMQFRNASTCSPCHNTQMFVIRAVTITNYIVWSLRSRIQMVSLLHQWLRCLHFRVCFRLRLTSYELLGSTSQCQVWKMYQMWTESCGHCRELNWYACLCVCVAYKYGVFDCQSPPDTLSCAVFSYGDLRTYIRHCCVLICTMDSDVACGGGCTGCCIGQVHVMVVPPQSYISVSSILVVPSDCWPSEPFIAINPTPYAV